MIILAITLSVFLAFITASIAKEKYGAAFFLNPSFIFSVVAGLALGLYLSLKYDSSDNVQNDGEWILFIALVYTISAIWNSKKTSLIIGPLLTVFQSVFGLFGIVYIALWLMGLSPGLKESKTKR